MKRYVIAEAGGNDKFQEEEVEVPTPNDGEVVVKNYVSATNPVDSMMRSSKGSAMGVSADKIVIGYDASGVVEKVGSGVKSLKVGDEVYYSGDVTKNGTYSQYTAVDAKIVGKKPKKLSWQEAAAMPLVTLTAMEALYECLSITEDKNANKDHSILIINGAGGVGSIAIQIAKQLLGLTVIATASREETIQFCKDNGADHVIDHKKDLKEQVDKLSLKNKTVEYIFSCHDPTEYFDKFPDLLSPLGKIALILPPSKPVNIGGFMAKRLSIHYELMFTRPMFNHQQEKQSEILDKTSELFDSGVLKSTMQKEFTFNLQGLKDAMDLQDSRKGIGKTVITWPK
ncbi:alcohol dehydrogenase [Acrasis kona]|uniref:Alcohol dehydrogenase n=1 Tax=Acrasis kona TaxID=1008807 RepID=A0AAW2ZA40_9EUKA